MQSDSSLEHKRSHGRWQRRRWAAAVVASCLAACGTEPANRAPEVQSAIPDQSLAGDGSAASLDVSGNFTDPDGDPLTYTVWSTNSDAAEVSVSGSVVTMRPVATRTATTTVTVRAQDPGGLTASLRFAVTVTVASPDLVVDVSPDSVVAAPGVAFEYVAAVRNEGNAPSAATRVRTFVSADSVVTTSDELVGDGAEVLALDPRETASRTASFTASLSSARTVFYVGECVDPVEGELDTRNNCSRALKVTIRASDLVVGMSPDSVATAPGRSVRFTVTIRNQGGAGATATRVRTFESADSVITTSDNEIGVPADVPALGAGESARGRVTVTVRGSASPGTVLYLGQCADAVQGESNTGNNCSNAVAIVVRAPDGDAGAAGQSRSARPDSAAVAVERIDRSRFFIRKEGNR